MYVVNHDAKYMIFMFPKSGCSTLRVLHLRLLKQVPTQSTFNEDPYHRIQRDSRHAPEYPDYIKVLVYRNPYERIASMFFQVFCGVPGAFKAGKLMRPRRRLSPTINTFNRFLDELFRKKMKFTWDQHFLPQHPSMPLNAFDQVLSLEDVDQLFRGVDDHLHSQVRAIMAAQNKTSNTGFSRNVLTVNRANFSGQTLEDYDFWQDRDKIISKNSVPPYHLLLTEAVKARIRMHYDDKFFDSCSAADVLESI